MIATKKCNYCHEKKTLSDFAKMKQSPDGHAYKCKSCSNEHNRLYMRQNKEDRKRYVEAYNAENYDRHRQRYKDNKKKITEINKRSYEKSKKADKEKFRKKWRDQYYRRVSTPIGRVIYNLRNRSSEAFRKAKISKPFSLTEENVLGCDMKTLKNHLESQFAKGMSWDNYGKWHVDHIKPISKFDLSDDEQIKECFNYCNLQPLWAADNIRKGSS